MAEKRKGINVVLLMSDQHAHDALGFLNYGNLETPTCDSLAAEGIHFRQATCAITPCLPSRQSLFQGRPAYLTGIYTNEHLCSPAALPSTFLSRLFQEAGYRTGAFGKMHFHSYGADIPRENVAGWDVRMGHFHETGETMDSHFVREHPDRQKALLEERESHGIDKGGDGCAEAFLGFTSQLTSRQRPDWWIAEKASTFIREAPEDPFFLVCSLPMPHAPHICPADLEGKYSPAFAPLPPEPPLGIPPGPFAGINRDNLGQAIANYMACVELADTCHGLVVEALKEAGVYEDTLVVYCSDHGEMLGSRGAGSFSKYTLYEQAIRVPLIVKPPASFKEAQPGHQSDSLISLLDLYPTLLECAGLSVPLDVSGIDFSKEIAGQAPTVSREITVTEFCEKPGQTAFTVRDKNWKWIRNSEGEALYHLPQDPYEFHNLLEKKPDHPERARLQSALLREWQRIHDRSSRGRLNYSEKSWDTLSL